MKTTLDLSEDLMERVIELSGKKTKRDAVTIAMEEFVRQKSIEALINLGGKVDIAETYEAMRERERTGQKRREDLIYGE